jgi:hypothetical protein
MTPARGPRTGPRCSANSMPVTKPMPDIVVRGSFCPGIARRVSAKFRCVWRRNIHPHRVIRTIVGKRHGTTAGSGGKNREHVGGARDVHHPDDAANGGERQPKRVVARVVRDARDARKKDGIEGKQLRIRPIPIETVAACVPSQCDSKNRSVSDQLQRTVKKPDESGLGEDGAEIGLRECSLWAAASHERSQCVRPQRRS